MQTPSARPRACQSVLRAAASGAGKTTLLDVLAGRKTEGRCGPPMRGGRRALLCVSEVLCEHITSCPVVHCCLCARASTALCVCLVYARSIAGELLFNGKPRDQVESCRACVALVYVRSCTRARASRACVPQ